jgi:predicted RNA-binding protein with TRAM domain
MSYASRTTRYGRSNYANRSFGSKPVETGKDYNLQITETSRRGDGVARIQGFVVFVKGGRAGQNVKAKVTSVSERFATAEVVV